MTQNEQEQNIPSSSEYTVEELIEKTKSYFRYLKKNRYKILLFGIIFAALGVAIAMRKKAKYTARITFAMHEEGGGGGAMSGLASQLGLAIGGGGVKGVYSGFNIVPFLTSRLMVQKTLLTPAQFKDGPELLVNYFIKFNHFDAAFQKDKNLKNLKFTANQTRFTRAQDSVLNMFYHMISDRNIFIDRFDKRSTIVLLEYTDKDELFTKNFIETLMANAMEYYVDVRTKKSADNLKQLQLQYDIIRKKLDNALIGVASSADATPNANPMRQTLRVSSQRRMIDVEAYSKSLVEITKSLELAKVSLTQDTPLIDYLDKPILPLEVKKLSRVLGGVLGFIFGIGLSITWLTFKKIAGKL